MSYADAQSDLSLRCLPTETAHTYGILTVREGPDQIQSMRRLIWVFGVRTRVVF